jgi:hypothetical protein
MAKIISWTHQFKWESPYTRPPQGDVLLIEIETDSQETPPEIERLRPAYPPGCGYAHILYCNKLESIEGTFEVKAIQVAAFARQMEAEAEAIKAEVERMERRRFDIVAAWSVDRLGRSLQHLVAFLEDIHGLGIDLYLHQQGIDTTTPAGRAMFQMLGVFSEFERAMIRDRVNTGLARAKAQGKTLGRPTVKPAIEEQIRVSLAAGVGIGKTARTLGVGCSVVQRVKKQTHTGTQPS